MYSNPTFNRYSFRFSSNFIYDNVKEQFEPLIKDMFNISLVGYINTTITNTTIPGITNDVVAQYDTVERNIRTFPSSMPSKFSREKKIDLTFKLKTNYMNWFILRAQFEEWIDKRKSVQNASRVFLPPVYLDILDRNGNAIISIEFKEVQMLDLDALNFSILNRGIDSKDFGLSIGYNRWDLSLNNKLQSNFDADDHIYNKHIY